MYSSRAPVVIELNALRFILRLFTVDYAVFATHVKQEQRLVGVDQSLIMHSSTTYPLRFSRLHDDYNLSSRCQRRRQVTSVKSSAPYPSYLFVSSQWAYENGCGFLGFSVETAINLFTLFRYHILAVYRGRLTRRSCLLHIKQSRQSNKMIMRGGAWHEECNKPSLLYRKREIKTL